MKNHEKMYINWIERGMILHSKTHNMTPGVSIYSGNDAPVKTELVWRQKKNRKNIKTKAGF